MGRAKGEGAPVVSLEGTDSAALTAVRIPAAGARGDPHPIPRIRLGESAPTVVVPGHRRAPAISVVAEVSAADGVTGAMLVEVAGGRIVHHGKAVQLGNSGVAERGGTVRRVVGSTVRTRRVTTVRATSVLVPGAIVRREMTVRLATVGRRGERVLEMRVRGLGAIDRHGTTVRVRAGRVHVALETTGSIGPGVPIGILVAAPTRSAGRIETNVRVRITAACGRSGPLGTGPSEDRIVTIGPGSIPLTDVRHETDRTIPAEHPRHGAARFATLGQMPATTSARHGTLLRTSMTAVRLVRPGPIGRVLADGQKADPRRGPDQNRRFLPRVRNASAARCGTIPTRRHP